MLELAIALTLYGDNFLRNIAKASRETDTFKALTSSLKNEKAFDVLAKEVKRTERETQEAEKEFKSLSSTIRKTFDPKNLNAFSEKLEDITLKAGAIGGAITLGLKSVVTDATEFEKGLAEASTLVKTDFEKFKKLYSNQLLEISVSLGQEKSAVTKAFYDAISSGFDPKKALEIIKQAGKSAIAGVSDISTANNTLITVMKAWGLNLKEASDYIFKTVAKGRTTFTEIARNIGGVAAIISSAGVKFKEFSAIVAAATAKGLDTAQTMTSIREIVNALVSPTTQAEKAFQKLGITVNKETLKQKGLVGTLKEITDAMKQAGLTEAEQAKMLSEIFGSVEAQKVVNMFIADPESFVNTLKEFQQVGGETDEAFKKMSQSTAFAFSRLSEAISSTKIVLGNLFLPVVNTAANILTGFAINVKNLIDNHQTLASVIGWSVGLFGLLAAATASFAAIGAFAAKSLSLLGEGFNFYRKTGKTLLDTLKKASLISKHSRTVFGALRLAVVETGKGMFFLSKSIMEVVKSSLFWSKQTAISAVGALRNFASSVVSFLIPAIRNAILTVRTFTATLLTNPLFLVATAIATAGFLIYKNWDKVKTIISTLWKAFKGFFAGIGELIGKASHIGSSILSAFKDFANSIGLLLSKAVEAGKSAFVSLAKAVLFYSPFGILVREWQKVFKLLSSINLFKAGSKIISTLIEGVKSKAKELYDAVKGTLSKVRNLLPFSPAKEGPLSDLHKTGLRFVETIAEGIKEDSLTAKVSSIMKKVKDFFWTPVQIRTSVQPVKLLHKAPDISLPSLTLPEIKPLSIFQPIRFLLSRLPEVKLPPLIQTLTPLFQPARLPEINFPPLVQTVKLALEKLPKLSLTPLFQPVKFILSRLPEVNLPPLIQKVKTATALNLFPALLTTGLAQPSFPVPYQKPLSISHISTHNSPAIHHHNEIHIHITVNGKANREDAIEIAKIVRAEVEKLQREQLRKEMRIGYGVGTHYTS